MKLEFYNCPKPKEFPDQDSRVRDEQEFLLPPKPEFMSYRPDFEAMDKLSDEYKNFKNILIIGHGGSVTSFYGFYEALRYQAKKQAFFLSTVDPDYIFELKQKLDPKETLVFAISKSGETTTQIEMMMTFVDFPMIVITGKSSPLRAAAEKLNAKIILHPPIGGRYTGFTEVGLLPAAVCGLDAKGLYAGAKTFFDLYNYDNLSWRAANIFYQLEQQGFVDVFMPFYSRNLFPMSNLIVQLCHESFGKNGQGQTYFAHEAPESQHHTNQRFFGGRKNICGFFLSSETFRHQTINIFPSQLHSVQIKGHALFDLNKIPLETALEFELAGTLEDARIQGIPVAHLAVAGFSPSEIGALAAFWQLYAVYASALRGVNPFDQPQVENSKNISFHKRLEFKGLL